MPEDHDGVNRSLNRARLLLEEGQFDLALAGLEEIQPSTKEQQQEKDYLCGWYFIHKKRWQEAERCLLPLATNSKFEEESSEDVSTIRARRALYLHLLGNVAVNLNRYEDAARHFRKCLSLFASRPYPNLPKVLLRARYGLGMTCIMNGFYSEAVVHYQEALQLAGDDEANVDLPHIYYGMCDAYRHLGMFEIAYNCGVKALHLYMHNSDHMYEGGIRTLLGRISYQLGDLQSGADHYTEALSIGTINQKPIIVINSFTGLADVRLAEKRFETARRFCQHACDMLEEVKDDQAVGMMYLVGGKIAQEEAAEYTGEHRQELLEEAISWFKKADARFSSIQARTMSSEVHGRWAQVLEDLGRHWEAMMHWKSAYSVLSADFGS